MSIKQKIAIYGLSTETERELPKLLEKYEVIGLVDSFQTDGLMYGQKIVTIEEALNSGIEKIFVIARPGSCKAIVKRIGKICKQKDVQIFDIRGKDLLEDKGIAYDYKSIAGYTQNDLLEAIKNADAVSFDLFDTLVVRKVFTPTDIIDILASEFSENKNFSGIDFANRRVAAEKQLSQNGSAPRLESIYRSFCKSKVMAKELAEKEFAIDLNCLQARIAVTKLISTAKGLGKKVYITSDTYYSLEQIQKILEATAIKDYDALFLSCEEETSKSGELYEVLKRKSGAENVLHIGDDLVSDIENAKAHGIKAFQIYSPSELLDLAGGLGFEAYEENLSDRIRIGMFIANLFNSPFQFEGEGKKLHIDYAKDIGYLISAPMIFDFVSWFKEQANEKSFSDVWFGARDGYLIKQIYELMKPEKTSQYFLTSRISAIRAGVENESDISYVDSMKFSGPREANLKRRFGLEYSSVSPEDIDNRKKGLTGYSKAILRAAKTKKENNEKYISALKLGSGDIAFFDFVAKGTSQMYTQRLVKNHICGFYFLQLEPEYMKDKGLDIVPFYKEEERTDSAIFEDYYILETILTSPDPSVEEFDDLGKPIYAKETRSGKDIACIMKVQEGVLEYTKKYLSICPEKERKVNKKLDEAFLQLIHHIEIRDADFLNLKVEDPFFNRTTDLTDIL